MSSRRDFLKQSSLAAAGFTAFAPSAAAQDNPLRGPDLVLVNGIVYTVDAAKPKAEAFAVKHGRFVAVGSNDEIKKLATSTTKVIDADGMTVVPGFIDAHTPSGVGGHLRAARRQLRSPHDRRDQGGDPPARRQDAGRRLGLRLQVRRHQAEGRPAAARAGPRRGRAEASGARRRIAAGIPPSCNSLAFQLAGVDAGHARSGRRQVRPRRQGRADRLRRREGPRRLRQGRHAAAGDRRGSGRPASS